MFAAFALPIGLGLLALLLFVAVVFVLLKPKGNSAQFTANLMPQHNVIHAAPAQSPAVVRQLSMRKLQLEEDAADVAALFVDAEESRYREELRLRAANSFGGAKV